VAVPQFEDTSGQTTLREKHYGAQHIEEAEFSPPRLVLGPRFTLAKNSKPVQPIQVEIRDGWRWRSIGPQFALHSPERRRFRRMRRIAAIGSLVGSLIVSYSAAAHSFGTPYNLPVPFWLYAFGASAALLLSFMVTAYFARIPASVHVDAAGSARLHDRLALSAGIVSTLRASSFSALLLSIFAGFVGSPDAGLNINMTLFWAVFALAFFYLTAFIGDLYYVINPWRSLCTYIEAVVPNAFVARMRFPDRLRYWPALILYVAYIWVELFGGTQPRSLALILIAYTAINLGAAALVGKDAWFRYGEFFSVLFRLAGMLSPIEYLVDDGDRRFRLRFRRPLSALFTSRAKNAGELLFILFALSSTAFDGFHETTLWVSVFWIRIYPLLQSALALPYRELVAFYYYWQWGALVVSPIFYFGLYAMFTWLAQMLAGSSIRLRCLALSFAYSIVPIAFAYNAAHYFAFAVSQVAEVLHMASDPFGFGWDLFGTAHWVKPVILGAEVVWHMQVGLIVLGHILAVYVAHVESLRLFANARQALMSQLPMLVLMMIFTTLGLWILSLPIAAGTVIQPTG
jgi:hypothetical protein